LLSFPVEDRRAQVRDIVANWLKEAGAIRVERVRKADDARPPKLSPPCKCDCASCVHCVSKGATASEAKDGAIVRTDLKAVDAQIEDALERLFAAGQGWVNLGLNVNDFTRKVWSRCEVNELRLLDAVKRANRNGSLKLVGGQPR
jgi:hypothetical protein